MTLAELVARLAEPKQTAAGFDARCPAHEDSHASLSVGEGAKGLVVRCHAGCSARDVLAALGLEMKDLFSAPSIGVHAYASSPAPASAARPASAPRARIVAEYDYLDASGACSYQVVRFDPKDFRQRRPARGGEPAKNGWVWSLKGVPLVLYRLPAVLAAAAAHQRVYIVEGEKDADNLARLGVVATSAPGGASKKWLEQYSEALRGSADVVVIPDKDAPGQQHASKVLAALNVAGIPARSLILPGDGKDASDWIAAGGSAQALETLAGAAPPSRPALHIAASDDRPGPAPLRGLGKNLESACRLMRDDTARGLALWPGGFGYNLMSGRIEAGGKPVEDHHITHVREQVASTYSMPGGATPLRLTAEQVREALELVAHEREFHPVEAWLKSLPSAGAGHIERIAVAGLGLSVPREIGLVRKWFISAAARALRPGCQVDTALVLAGEQGVLKTSFFRVLAGPWYGSGPVRPDDKDTLLRLHRSWIYEWAELASMNRRGLEELRDFMTTTTDFWRPSYGRTIVERPRRAVFAGSTNVLDFLRDNTGNRRFWPLHILSAIDVAVAAELREAAFAEARDAFLAGERWWLSREEEPAQAEATAEFEETDVWEGPIADWLVGQADYNRNCFTTLELLRFAVKADTDGVGERDAHRVAAVMRRIGGWVNSRVRLDGRARARAWHPESDSVDLAGLPSGYKDGEP